MDKERFVPFFFFLSDFPYQDDLQDCLRLEEESVFSPFSLLINFYLYVRANLSEEIL